jgi:hypothetical protein
MIMKTQGTRPLSGTRDRFRLALEDIRHGRHREAYGLFLIGVVLVVLGLVGVVGDQVMLSAILLALTFLVLHTATEPSDRELPPLDRLLITREGFGAFGRLLPGVRDLRVYGPTAVGLLVHAADIRRFVLHTGGKARFLVLSSDPWALALAAIQLDDNLDLEHALSNSLATLDKLSEEPGFSYRNLPLNPGFSLVIVNADESDGYVIFESHGFKDENIADRMHIVIQRSESPHWFTYWVSRFEAMWETAEPQQP